MNRELSEIRASIDEIDREIINLLEKRMQWALQTRMLKTDIINHSREKEVINNILRCQRKLLSDEFCEKIYSLIINESRNLQMKDAEE